MTARIKLRHGNMFDGPSDLIVLPCNTNGGVTGFVADHLRNFHIPPPQTKLGYGDIRIMPFTGGENIAQFVAYAASVMYTDSTSPNAIENIGRQLGEATKNHDLIRAIAAPLLGAGAGGLPSGQSVLSLRKGFQSKATSDSVLTISILHTSVYERVKNNIKGEIRNLDADVYKESTAIRRRETPPPRTFISYTSTNEKHKTWVKSLGIFLRENGVDARLDMWHLRRGMDLPQWMCNELQIADKVIIISDEKYAQKADGRHGGVGWETMMIQGDMASQAPENTKYVAIIRTDEYEEGLPRYLKTKYCFHWPENCNENQLRNELLRELFGVSDVPPIGEPPFYI